MKILWKKKTGVFHAKITHRTYTGPPLALVKFEGNTRLARIRVDELTFINSPSVLYQNLPN